MSSETTSMVERLIQRGFKETIEGWSNKRLGMNAYYEGPDGSWSSAPHLRMVIESTNAKDDRSPSIAVRIPLDGGRAELERAIRAVYLFSRGKDLA